MNGAVPNNEERKMQSKAELSQKFFDTLDENFGARLAKECNGMGLCLKALTWQQREYFDLCLEDTGNSLFELFEVGLESLESLNERYISCAIESYRLEYPNK